MVKNLRSWFIFSLANLAIVALYGTMMRYKIGFEFPWLDQKFLLHAHSHFAFAGWITQTLMVLLVLDIREKISEQRTNLYHKIFIANISCAYGMLIAFTLQGYGPVAITFSTLSIFVSWFFVWKFSSDLRKKAPEHPSKNWYLAALAINVLSTLGTFALVYMMVTKNIQQNWYMAAIYYYLHFQYNGWFFFVCMGLLWSKCVLKVPGILLHKSIFRLLLIACIPAYFLSVLWIRFPEWLYWVIVLSAAVQLIAWGKLLLVLRKHISVLKEGLSKFSTFLFFCVTITLSLKFLLQLFSTIPIMSKLAFGFRPIVIAYLHLVLLAVISLFLLAWLYSFRFIRINRVTTIGLAIFVAGIFLNEFMLMIQGIASFAYFPVPYVNEILFLVAMVMLIGGILLVISQLKKSETQQPSDVNI